MNGYVILIWSNQTFRRCASCYSIGQNRLNSLYLAPIENLDKVLWNKLDHSQNIESMDAVHC